MPGGTRIAFTGGTDCNDHKRIWSALDRVHTKHPDMVLLHGGSPRGAERVERVEPGVSRSHRNGGLGQSGGRGDGKWKQAYAPRENGLPASTAGHQ